MVGDPATLRTLKQIAAEFRADDGTSLRDIVNGLRDSAARNERAAADLAKRARALELREAEDRASATERKELLEALTRELVAQRRPSG